MSVKIVNAAKPLLANVLQIATTAQLSQQDYTPDASMDSGDMTACDFSGYAADFTSAFANAVADGDLVYRNAVASFVHDGGATGNDVYVYYRALNGSDDLMAGRFSGAPITLDEIGERIDLLTRFEFGQFGDLAASNFVVDDGGENALLNSLDDTANEKFRITPYVNAHTPTKNDVIGDYTAASASGLGSQEVVFGSGSATNGDGDAERVGNMLQFDRTNGTDASETIYGVYYEYSINAGSTWTLVGGEEFSSPVVAAASGEGFEFIPRFRLRSIN